MEVKLESIKIHVCGDNLSLVWDSNLSYSQSTQQKWKANKINSGSSATDSQVVSDGVWQDGHYTLALLQPLCHLHCRSHSRSTGATCRWDHVEGIKLVYITEVCSVHYRVSFLLFIANRRMGRIYQTFPCICTTNTCNKQGTCEKAWVWGYSVGTFLVVEWTGKSPFECLLFNSKWS